MIRAHNSLSAICESITLENALFAGMLRGNLLSVCRLSLHLMELHHKEEKNVSN